MRAAPAVRANTVDNGDDAVVFDGLADNQRFKHGADSYEPGRQVPVDPDELEEWQEQAVQAGVASIQRVPNPEG